MRRPEHFRDAVRRGRRAGTLRLVVHLRRPTAPVHSAVHSSVDSSLDGVPLVGFVVSRAVGGAVVRNRVARRLRHQLRERLERLPAGGHLVVRALPAAAEAPSAVLADDLDRALERLLSRP